MGNEGGGIRSEEGVGVWREEEEGGGRVRERVVSRSKGACVYSLV